MAHKSIGKTAVVIVNYKAVKETLSCIDSIFQQTYKDIHIVVVENGSGDNSAETLRHFQKKHVTVTILYNNENRGFAGGVNTGISWADKHNYDYVALFNNDAIAEPTWLEKLVRQADTHDSYGIVTGLLLHSDGKTIDSTGEQLSIWGLAFPRDRHKKTTTAHDSGLVFGGTGGASLYRMTTLRAIGLFDETFFAYFEDVDISFRVQLAGWKVYYESGAIAYHKQGMTSSKMPGFTVYQNFKNLPLVLAKNVPHGLLFSIYIRFWPAYFLMLGNAIFHGNGKVALTGYFQSIRLFWTHALSARRHIQATKKVDTSYIHSILWHDLPPGQTGIRKLRRLFTGKP
jgi:hypothetical protein